MFGLDAHGGWRGNKQLSLDNADLKQDIADLKEQQAGFASLVEPVLQLGRFFTDSVIGAVKSRKDNCTLFFLESLQRWIIKTRPNCCTLLASSWRGLGEALFALG